MNDIPLSAESRLGTSDGGDRSSKRRHVSEFWPAERTVAAYRTALDELTTEMRDVENVLFDARDHRTALIRSGPGSAAAIDRLKAEIREIEDRTDDLTNLRDGLLKEIPFLERDEIKATDEAEAKAVEEAWMLARDLLTEEYPHLSARLVEIARSISRAERMQELLRQQRVAREKVLFDEPLRPVTGLGLSVSPTTEINVYGHHVAVVGFARALKLPGVVPTDGAPERVPYVWPEPPPPPPAPEKSPEEREWEERKGINDLPRTNNPEIFTSGWTHIR